MAPIKKLLMIKSLTCSGKKPIIPIENGKKYIAPVDSENNIQVFKPYKQNSHNQSFFHTIDLEILNQKNAQQFFKLLDIKEPQKIDEIKKSILPNYKQENHKVSIKQYRQNILFIAEAYTSENQDERIVKLLKNIPIVLTEEGYYRIPNDSKGIYFPSKIIRQWFDGNNEVEIVKGLDMSEEDEQNRTKLFRKLGCLTELEQNSGNWEGEHEHGDHQESKDGFNPDFYIHGIEYSLEHISLERSKIIWKILLKNYKHFRGEILTSKRQNMSYPTTQPMCSRTGEILKEHDWLYNRENKLIPRKTLEKYSFEHLHPSYEKGEDVSRDKLVKSLGMLSETLTLEEHNEKISEEKIKRKNAEKRAEEEGKRADKERKRADEAEKKLCQQKNRQPFSSSQSGQRKYWSNERQDAETPWEPKREADGSSEISDAKRPDSTTYTPSQKSSTKDTEEQGNSKPKATPQEVGKWGEEEVFLKFKEKYPAGENEMEWMNENGESFQPYDIHIKRNGTPDIYVEVKTTTSASPYLFEITGEQWNHARKCQAGEISGEYQICAVFKAGTDESSISVLENPVEEFKADKLDARPLGLKITGTPIGR